jgi:hypothetical protein
LERSWLEANDDRLGKSCPLFYQVHLLGLVLVLQFQVVVVAQARQAVVAPSLLGLLALQPVGRL